MTDAPRPRTGGQILVDQLARHGVGDIFCVPGESYLAVLDALHDAQIRLTVCRQEGGAAMMAEAHGKLTGKPGICFVTRGPGATNASPGLHIAKQDSTPMILFVGQIERAAREREAFQELDYRAVFGTIAKWVTEIDSADRLPELIARAFHVATAGRPGPVVIALPEDMLVETATVADAPAFRPVETHPALSQMVALQNLLAQAEKPFAILGGSRWSAEAVRRFTRFADLFSLPVACSFRRQGHFPADHRCYAGDLGLGVNPKLLARIKESDLLLVVGGRLSEIPSQGYTLSTFPARASASSTSIPIRRSWAASTARRSPSTRARPPSRRRSRRCSRPAPCPGPPAPRPCTPITLPGAIRPGSPPRARSRWAA